MEPNAKHANEQEAEHTQSRSQKAAPPPSFFHPTARKHDPEHIKTTEDLMWRLTRPSRFSTYIPKKRDWRWEAGIFGPKDGEQEPYYYGMTVRRGRKRKASAEEDGLEGVGGRTSGRARADDTDSTGEPHSPVVPRRENIVSVGAERREGASKEVGDTSFCSDTPFPTHSSIPQSLSFREASRYGRNASGLLRAEKPSGGGSLETSRSWFTRERNKSDPEDSKAWTQTNLWVFLSFTKRKFANVQEVLDQSPQPQEHGLSTTPTPTSNPSAGCVRSQNVPGPSTPLDEQLGASTPMRGSPLKDHSGEWIPGMPNSDFLLQRGNTAISALVHSRTCSPLVGPPQSASGLDIEEAPQATAPRPKNDAFIDLDNQSFEKTAESADLTKPKYSIPVCDDPFVDVTKPFNIAMVLSELRDEDEDVGEMPSNFNWFPEATPADALFPPGIPLSGAEILAFYPHHVRYPGVMWRFMNNNLSSGDIIQIQAWFRSLKVHPKTRQEMYDFQRKSGRIITHNTKWVHGNMVHIPTTNLFVDHFEPAPTITPRERMIPTFEQLVQGVKILPQGIHAGPLTVCIAWYIGHRDLMPATLKTKLNVLHTRALSLALQQPVVPIGEKNVDMAMVKQWKETGSLGTRDVKTERVRQRPDGDTGSVHWPVPPVHTEKALLVPFIQMERIQEMPVKKNDQGNEDAEVEDLDEENGGEEEQGSQYEDV